MSRATLSVVVPLYNHERYIEAALDSVLSQSVPAAEIIVVDDGSTDGSATKVRALCEKHPQIIFWSQPNQGAYYTLNAGIHRATGEFVSILNSDDVYSPTRFEECLKVFYDEPEVSAVATGLSFIDTGGTEIQNQWYQDARSFYERCQDLSLALINSNFLVTTSNLFVRKSVFEEIGYFVPLRYTHDVDFFLRLLAWGKSVYFLDEALLKYRFHPRNTIQEDDIKVQVERAAVVAFYLYSAWLNRVRDPKDWHSYIAKLTEITDRQALGALLFHFLDHLDRLSPTAMPHGLWTCDNRFRRFLREATGQPATTGFPAEEPQSRVEQNERLKKELALRDAVISDQKGRIGKLEEGKQWLAGQNERLQKALEKCDAAIADQLEKCDAAIADQKAWIGKLTERNEQLQREVDEIKRSQVWRVLNALRSIFGSRR